jgi:hypothetical protein
MMACALLATWSLAKMLETWLRTAFSPSSDRESPYPQAHFLYDYHAALSQGLFYVRQAIQKEFRLSFGTPP